MLVRAAALLAALCTAGALAALCADSVNICVDGVQTCCCVGGPPVCVCCSDGVEACVAGACVPASATPTPSPSATPTLSTGASPSATQTPSRSTGASPTPSRSAGASPSASQTPSASRCAAAGGADVLACGGGVLVLAPGAAIVQPLAINATTRLVAAGSLEVAAPLTFATDAPPVLVLNGTLWLRNNGSVVVHVPPDDTRTRVVLFAADNISSEPAFSVDTDAACTAATADTSVRGEFAVLLTPRGCGNGGDGGEWRWVLVALGVACACAVGCVVCGVALALLALRFGRLRWVFREREKASDAIVSPVVRDDGSRRRA
jgi:hypothetical protein